LRSIVNHSGESYVELTIPAVSDFFAYGDQGTTFGWPFSAECYMERNGITLIGLHRRGETTTGLCTGTVHNTLQIFPVCTSTSVWPQGLP
jgi:hypothetical protein